MISTSGYFFKRIFSRELNQLLILKILSIWMRYWRLARKRHRVELGFQLVERIRHGLGRAVVQAKERIAFVQSDVADIFHLHGNIAVAVRQKKTLAITVIALPHIFQ